MYTRRVDGYYVDTYKCAEIVTSLRCILGLITSAKPSSNAQNSCWSISINVQRN